ncbi:MAG: DUF99 family protein [Halobacteria archaeon]|nr:DUF99 family protein [Halobacteria archaeon]
MKEGIRVLGVAESYTPGSDESVLGGVVMRGDGRLDGFVFGSSLVGGTDVTDSVIDMYDRLDRDDIHAVMVGGIAVSWYNVVDLRRIEDETGVPALSVSFEEGGDLTDSIRDEFEGEEADERVEVYERQPERRRVEVETENTTTDVFVRSVGIDEEKADSVVRMLTTHGKRPEPVRIGRLVARAADAWEGTDGDGETEDT